MRCLCLRPFLSLPAADCSLAAGSVIRLRQHVVKCGEDGRVYEKEIQTCVDAKGQFA